MRTILLILLFVLFVVTETALSPLSLSAQSQDRLERMRAINPNLPMPILIDQSLIASHSIDSYSSRHLTLLTDIKGKDEIEELTAVFDLAVDQWCKYFGIDSAKTNDWHLRGMVIADRAKFKNAKLIPADLPDFPAGFQRGHEMWVYLQPGNYYTRHLLLHEGTHSFMQWFLGGTGAPWYTEGMAELLGVHRWDQENLRLNYKLTDRSQAEYWGRIKLIHKDIEKGNILSLDEIFNIPSNSFREVRFYAWSWAACEFFSQHPDTNDAFSNLKNVAHRRPNEFNRSFANAIQEHRPKLERDWNLFIEEIDFGYDVPAGIVTDSKPVSDDPLVVAIESGASWQTTNVQVKPGDQFTISGSGRFTIAKRDGVEWPCESGGVSIEYYRGHPLGQLMAGVLGKDGTVSGLKRAIPVGLNRQIGFDTAGTLCLRVNESPSQLFDNKGTIPVTITRKKR